MAQVPPEIDRLISLDDSSEFESSFEDITSAWERGLPALEPNVPRLKAENTDRLRKRWDEIIAKYSSVDDAKESDEIDLNTGRITIDNGHLRSYPDEGTHSSAHAFSSIWAVDNRFEKELRRQKQAEKLRRRLKHEEKERLKASGTFYNKKMRAVDFGTVPLPDNILLLTPSPTKKQKTTSSSPVRLAQSSPSMKRPADLSFGARLSTPKTSPLKQRLPSFPSSPNQSVLASPVRSEGRGAARSTESIRTNQASTDSHSELERLTPTQTIKLAREPNESDEFTEYDELFLITELCEPAPYVFFSCAFFGCRYASNSKASYRMHLLSSHSPELQQIGYPVNAESTHAYHIPGDTILKLNLHFPSKLDTPPDVPFECGSELGSGRCRKIFLSKSHLLAHKRQYPLFCSTRRQVLVCPILGCDFMTDASYEEYRHHMEVHKHDLTVRPTFLGTPLSGVEELADYFSESVPSINCSDREQQNSSEEAPLDECHSLTPKTLSIGLLKHTWLPEVPKTDFVPKLDILDDNVDTAYDCENLVKEGGYSSIDELFGDNS